MVTLTKICVIALGSLSTLTHSQFLRKLMRYRGLTVDVELGSEPRWTPPPLPLNQVAASNTGSAALPVQTTLPKYVLLGIGFQNYSCAGGNYRQAGPDTGAIATLYDITSSLTSSNVNSLSVSALHHFESCLASTGCRPEGTSYCRICHQRAIAAIVPYATVRKGVHFFAKGTGTNGPNVPSFDVFQYEDFLSATKTGDVKAPPTTCNGLWVNGTIDWLYLVDDGSNRSHGLSDAYRVETAGGASPMSCVSEGKLISIPYTAQYWFWR